MGTQEGWGGGGKRGKGIKKGGGKGGC